MTFDKWMDDTYGEDTRPDLRRMARESWRAAQEEIQKRAVEKIRADCTACGGSGYASHPDDPNPTDCEYCGRPIRTVATLPLEGDDAVRRR